MEHGGGGRGEARRRSTRREATSRCSTAGEKKGWIKEMTCGVKCQRVEGVNSSRSILVYTEIWMPACGTKRVKDVENGMLQISNEL